MQNLFSQISAVTLNWLLEKNDPGVRYLALRDLVKLTAEDKDLQNAALQAHQKGPIAEVLSHMDPAGFWEEPGSGYNPKYRSTVWSVILLAQLGASAVYDARIQTACEYLLENNLKKNMYFTTSNAPSGTVDCLQGNLCWALLELGCHDTRLDGAIEWLARSQTGEEIAPKSDKNAAIRYYAGKCGPNFACGGNGSMPCAWGAVKVMKAFGALDTTRRTALINQAIQSGVDFLFSIDPVTAAYPVGSGGKPNSSWWKFGFPVFYITDVLQIAETLTSLGYRDDPRMNSLHEYIQSKQDENGRWLLEYDYTGKTWGQFGSKNQPNKWVTLRAIRAL